MPLLLGENHPYSAPYLSKAAIGAVAAKDQFVPLTSPFRGA
tara:strand:- start:671 stop:793 length:123 start_codon:yes stop_codon:yes gene_type:complete